MADIIQQRRDTAARWAQYNPILLEGEVGYVTDNPNQYKIGNGVSRWNDLPLRGYNGTITQEKGNDENAVMSQAAVTKELSELGSKASPIVYTSDLLINKFLKELFIDKNVVGDGFLSLYMIRRNFLGTWLVRIRKDGEDILENQSTIEQNGVLWLKSKDGAIGGYCAVNWSSVEEGSALVPNVLINDNAFIEGLSLKNHKLIEESNRNIEKVNERIDYINGINELVINHGSVGVSDKLSIPMLIKKDTPFQVLYKASSDGRYWLVANDNTVKLKDYLPQNEWTTLVSSENIEVLELYNYSGGTSEIEFYVKKDNSAKIPIIDKEVTELKKSVENSVRQSDEMNNQGEWVYGYFKADGSIEDRYGFWHLKMTAKKGERFIATMPYPIGLDFVLVVKENDEGIYNEELKVRTDSTVEYQYIVEEDGTYIVNFRSGTTSYNGNGFQWVKATFDSLLGISNVSNEIKNIRPSISLCGNPSLKVEFGSLAGGEYYCKSYPQYIRGCICMSMWAKITSYNNIIFGLKRESQSYVQQAIELTPTDLNMRHDGYITNSVKHGLNINTFVSISINLDSVKGGYVVVNTLGGAYKHEYSADVMFKNIAVEPQWQTRDQDFQGHPYIKVDDATQLVDLVMSVNCDKYKLPIWYLGDSYTSIAPPRATYQLMVEWGVDKFFLQGLAGGTSSNLYEDLLKSLKFGTPKFLIWALGMNDADGDNAVNTSWLNYFNAIRQICENNGIEMIACTIPNTPTQNNYYKNEVVKKSGLRYIDFAKSVNAENLGAEWYQGCLDSDNVHPTELGAKVLASQVLVDFPEIMLDL